MLPLCVASKSLCCTKRKITDMKKRLILSTIGLASVLGVFSQVNENDSQGYFDRGRLMFQDENYVGCIDQMKQFKNLALSVDTEDVDYFIAMSSLALGYADSEELLSEFLINYPQSVKRADVLMSIGDIAFDAGAYGKALTAYAKIDASCFNGTRVEDYTYRVAYSKLMLAEYNEALDGFKSLSDSKKYSNEAKFYEGYIAYSQDDYVQAQQILSKVNTSVAPGNMADFYLSQIYFKNSDYVKAKELGKKMLKNKNADIQLVAEMNRIVGESYYNLGESDEALPYLQKYVDNVENPLPSTLYILGVEEYRDGNYQKAVELLGKVINNENEMGQSAYFFIGQASVKSGNNDAAIMAFDKALKMAFDKNIQEAAYYNYAVAEMNGGKVPFGSTVETFEAFLKRYPNSKYATEVQEYIVTGYMTDKNYESALASIQRIKNPSDAISGAKQRVLFIIATREMSKGEYSKALEYFMQAEKLKKHNADLSADCNLWIGQCHYEMGNYEKAETYLKKYLNSDVDFDGNDNRALAYYDLGYTYFQQKKYDEAKSAFESSLKSEPVLSSVGIADTYNRIGDCYYYAVDFGKASEYYEEAHQVNIESGDYALYQKAIMKGLARDHKGKIAVLEEVIKEYPTSGLIPLALLQMAESQLELGENDKAVKTYEKLVAKYPETAQGRNGCIQLAIAYLNKGDRENGIKCYKEIITKYPTSEEAKVAVEDLKRIYANSGNLNEFAQFIASVPSAPQLEVSEMDALTFQAAENHFLHTESEEKMRAYIEKYPNGAYVAQALSYLAQSQYDEGNDDEALQFAARIVENYPNAEVAEDALAIKGKIESRQGKGEMALSTFKQLEKCASATRNVNAARLGILYVSRDLGLHEEVVAVADKLLASSTLDESEIANVKFAKAFALNQMDKNKEAVELWQSLAEDMNDLNGAKSAYYLAQHYYDIEDLTNARKVVEKLIEANTPQQYWLARGFILLSDINRKEGKNFEAEEYLKILKENYPGSDADIFRMIDERLNNVE